MKPIQKLHIKIKTFKKEITAIYYAYQHPKLNKFPKIIILFTLGYALSPIDLIPDFIPVLGYLDDLLILPFLIMFSIKLIPHEIMNESRKKAENHPLQLKKKWIFAMGIIFIWAAIVTSVVILLKHR